jgi:hypothetical protein
MVKRLALGSLLGGIVLFVWGAIAWIIIPWPGEPLRAFTNEATVGQAVTANAPRSGNYLLPIEPKRAPGMSDEQYRAARQAAMDRMTHGPMIFAAVRLEPMGSTSRPLLIQLLTQLVLALMASGLLLQTGRLSYKGRVLFLTTVGVIIFVGGHADEWNWWSFSNAYMLMQFGAIVIGWLLASLVIAAFVRGRRVAAH